MSGLKNTVQKFINASAGRGMKTNEQLRRPKRAAERDALYASAMIPDEELIRRNEKRKSSARRGSRQRNVMTIGSDLTGDRDTLGG